MTQVTMSQCEFCGESVQASHHTAEACREALMRQRDALEETTLAAGRECRTAMEERDRLAARVQAAEEALVELGTERDLLAEASAAANNSVNDAYSCLLAAEEQWALLLARVQELEAEVSRLKEYSARVLSLGDPV